MTMILDGSTGEVFPTWTTATRPASPVTSQTGWNTTIGSLENYNGTAWTAVGGGGAGSWQSVQTTGFTAVAGNAYACNTTSAAFTVTLPASPTAGQYVQITDYAGTFGTNNCTIARNGNNINGAASNIILQNNRTSVGIVYIDSTQGWIAYSGFNSTPLFTSYGVNYLSVGGGGGGGGYGGGGGGAGGYIATTANLTVGTAYSIIVGAGGAGGVSAQNGSSGTNSTASFATTTVGGGYGGTRVNIGASGGSGGGAGKDCGSPSFGSGTSGQGSNGGASTVGGGGGSGGGGGAGTAGGNGGAGESCGAGGNGLASSISGASVTYAGGGGGSANGNGYFAAGGTGGGGSGGNGAGSNGSTNLGGGGGGGNYQGSGFNGGSGGSGVFIISYTGAQRGTGGTVTSAGGNTIHTFTSSGTYTA